MILATQHRGLLEYMAAKRAVECDKSNMLGPYRIIGPGATCRYFECLNYESCLSFAAKKRWDSFTCLGCTRTKNLRLV